MTSIQSVFTASQVGVINETAVTQESAKPKRLSFSEQRLGESLTAYEVRIAARRTANAKRMADKRNKITRGIARVTAEIRTDGETIPEALERALTSEHVLASVNGKDVKAIDVSAKLADEIRLQLSERFKVTSSPIGKIRNNFVSLNSRYARNIRFFNLQRTFEPWKVSKAYPHTVQLLSTSPYSEVATRRTFNYYVNTIRTDMVLPPRTKEELLASKPSADITMLWIDTAGRTDRIVTGKRITATGTPIAEEMQGLSRRAGYSYSAVLSTSQHSKVKTPAYWHTLPQHPTSVSTGQIELTAQYALGRADGVYTMWPRRTVLK